MKTVGAAGFLVRMFRIQRSPEDGVWEQVGADICAVRAAGPEAARLEFRKLAGDLKVLYTPSCADLGMGYACVLEAAYSDGSRSLVSRAEYTGDGQVRMAGEGEL